ncbi:hypothetical protein [Oceaniferula marina]|nr:hypothetical protein [Oceaniferula marina]
MRPILCIVCAMMVGLTPLLVNAEGAKPQPQPLSLRVLAIGESPPPEYSLYRSEDDEPEEEGSESSKGRGAGPRISAIPIMKPENLAHYPPRPVFVSVDKRGKMMRPILLTPGSLNPRFCVLKRESIQLSKRKQGGGKIDPARMSPLHKIRVPEASNHLLVMLKKLGTTYSWKDYRVHTVDLSPSKIPAGHVYLLNMSKAPIQMKDGADKTMELRPGQRILSKRIDENRAMRLIFEDGVLKKQVARKSFRYSDEIRYVVVVQDLLNKKPNGVKQGVMVIREPVELPELPPALKRDLKEASAD